MSYAIMCAFQQNREACSFVINLIINPSFVNLRQPHTGCVLVNL
jgi:hypothetical protein